MRISNPSKYDTSGKCSFILVCDQIRSRKGLKFSKLIYSRKENSSRHNFMYSNFLVFALIKACGVCWLSRVPELTICRKMSLQSLERPVDTQMSCVRHKHNFLLLSKFSFLPARRIINSFSYTKPTNGINCIIMAYWVKSGSFCTGSSETEKYIK